MSSAPKILYVDDEEINLRIFKHSFQREYNIFVALSGEKGLEILEKEDIDLIVTDQRMPGMSGVEFLEKVLSLKPEPNRILITAYSDFNAVTNAVNKGKIFQYISKPWKKEEIKPILDQAVEVYYLKKENKELNTELKQQLNEKGILLDKLQIALQKAEESDRLKTAFLRNISHEIRTPMNAILGFSAMIESEKHGENTIYVNTIQKSIDELLKKIESIIEFSQLQTTEYVPVIESFSVEQIVNDTYNNFKNNLLILNNDVKLNLINGEKIIIETDFGKLQSILLKVLDNAVKFTESGKIEIGWKKENDSVTIYTEDTGIGISQEQAAHAFDPFYKNNDNSKVYTGLGLGLSIVKKYSEILGFQISLKPKSGKGSVFEIKIKIK